MGNFRDGLMSGHQIQSDSGRPRSTALISSKTGTALMGSSITYMATLDWFTPLGSYCGNASRERAIANKRGFQ